MEPKHALRRHHRKPPSRGKSGAGKARLEHAGTNSTGLFAPDYDDVVIKWAPLVVPLFAVMLVVIVYLAIGTLFTLT
jgi:hypothetical protein